MKLATIPSQQCESLCLKELKQGLHMVRLLVNGLLERRSYLPKNIKNVEEDIDNGAALQIFLRR